MDVVVVVVAVVVVVDSDELVTSVAVEGIESK